MTVYIQLITAGADTGPFNLYSNVDAYVSAFETSVSKIDLTSGYTSNIVPDGTTNIRVKSSGSCISYIDIPVSTTTTTTTTIACNCTEVTYIGESSADFTYIDCYGVSQTETISSFGTTNWCGSMFSTADPDISFNSVGSTCTFDGEVYSCPL
jgi:hypothetical protein